MDWVQWPLPTPLQTYLESKKSLSVHVEYLPLPDEVATPMLFLCLIGAVALPLGVLVAQVGLPALRRICLFALLLSPGVFLLLDRGGPVMAGAPISLIIFVELLVFALPIGCTILFGLVGYYLARSRMNGSDDQ